MFRCKIWPATSDIWMQWSPWTNSDDIGANKVDGMGSAIQRRWTIRYVIPFVFQLPTTRTDSILHSFMNPAIEPWFFNFDINLNWRLKVLATTTTLSNIAVRFKIPSIVVRRSFQIFEVGKLKAFTIWITSSTTKYWTPCRYWFLLLLNISRPALLVVGIFFISLNFALISRHHVIAPPRPKWKRQVAL